MLRNDKREREQGLRYLPAWPPSRYGDTLTWSSRERALRDIATCSAPERHPTFEASLSTSENVKTCGLAKILDRMHANNDHMTNIDEG